MPASNYLDDAILNATLTNTPYTGPATVYVALYSVAPTKSTSGTELSGSNYSRQSASFSVSTGVATSTASVAFGAASADWSTAVAWAILDDSTGGNILYFGSLSPSQTVLNGNTLTFATGDITVTMD